MSACTGTRVPTNTGVRPIIYGSERTTDDSFFMEASSWKRLLKPQRYLTVVDMPTAKRDAIPCVNFSRCGAMRAEAMTLRKPNAGRPALWPIAYCDQVVLR